MTVLDFDAFEAWVRDRSRGCMEQSEIDELCKGGFDLDGEWYGFVNPSIQAQWEVWQAALLSKQYDSVTGFKDYGLDATARQMEPDSDYHPTSFDDAG